LTTIAVYSKPFLNEAGTECRRCHQPLSQHLAFICKGDDGTVIAEGKNGYSYASLPEPADELIQELVRVMESVMPALPLHRRTAIRIAIGRARAGVSAEKNYHFTDEQVMGALVGTDHLRSYVENHLAHMTSGEKWSLYRAIVKLSKEATEAR
jgi:hypothetical protein